MRTYFFSRLAAILVFSTLTTFDLQAQEAWGALVACCYAGNGSACGDGVSTGYGSGSTQAEARSNALSTAMSDTNQSPQWKCSTVRTFNRGCGYIAEACNQSTKKCGWAVGATQEEALRKLSSQGLQGDGDSARGGGCIGQ